MARDGVTFEQVAAAAESLVARGDKPTNRAVRAALGGVGSANTIHRHLAAWTGQRPRAVAPPREVPANVLRGLQGEIERAIAEARAPLEEELGNAKQAAEDLAVTGEALERERDTLTAEVDSLKSETLTWRGRAEEQAAEIARVSEELAQERQRFTEELARERAAAEQARIEVAQERLTTENQRQRLAEQLPEMERLRKALEAEQTARVEAQREQAALRADKTSLSERLAEAQTRERAAEAEVVGLRERLEALIGTERAATADVARLTRELGETREARARAQDERKRLRSDVEKLEREAKARDEALAQAKTELANAQRDLAAFGQARQELEQARAHVLAAAVENARLAGQLEALSGTTANDGAPATEPKR